MVNSQVRVACGSTKSMVKIVFFVVLCKLHNNRVARIRRTHEIVVAGHSKKRRDSVYALPRGEEYVEFVHELIDLGKFVGLAALGKVSGKQDKINRTMGIYEIIEIRKESRLYIRPQVLSGAFG